MSHTLIRAAAGCGKTTELARRYLAFIAAGVPVERAIAITFTRRAAAELIERVTLALRACLDGPEAKIAQEQLGAAWDLYAAVAPTDPECARQALMDLPSAPIGTTDHFVHRFLTEYALFAAVPLPDGHTAALDVPIAASVSLDRALEQSARRILDPADGQLDADVALLCRYFSLDEVVGWMRKTEAFEHLPVASISQVFSALAPDLARVLLPLHAGWRVADRTDLDAWSKTLMAHTRSQGQWALKTIVPWMFSGGDPQQAPSSLGPWLQSLDPRKSQSKQIENALRRTPIDLGAATLNLADLVATLRPPFQHPAQLQLADQVQAARERIRQRVVVATLTQAAAAGTLDHHALTEAAIEVCTQVPDRLNGRFEALLVDEIQDANAVQLRLYAALAALPGPQPLRTVYVGDARQSIYLFRGAEPTGFQRLVQTAFETGAEVVDLQTNHRSHAALVLAQRALFGALTAPMRHTGHQPLADLTGLKSNAALAHLALDPAHHANPSPVWLVLPESGEVGDREMDERALRAFWERVQCAWTEPNHDDDTAVVLTTSWRQAKACCALIRTWAGQDAAAAVAGGGRWIEGPVGDDLRNLLAALANTHDQIAWMGVWKHPAIGLSDRALARIRAGDDRLGSVVDLPELPACHDDVDRAAFSVAAPHLRQARANLGTKDTATVLDRLATGLDWRMLLRAGPGGEDDLAALEVALDLIRSLSSLGQPPADIAQSLAVGLNATELPKIHLRKPHNTIICTTVFQAKGLAWDHVYATSPGRAARLPNQDAETAWIALHGQRLRLVGLKFDPTGGLSHYKDPMGRLAAKIGRFRQEEECARTAYVALTRARRSVTMGLPTNTQRTQPLQKIIAEAWRNPALSQQGVSLVLRPELAETQRPPTGWTAVASHPEPPVESPSTRSWSLRQPSNFSAHLSVQQRQTMAQDIAKRALDGGFHLGAESIDPPASLGIGPSVLGDLAHGWFSEWAFSGQPSEQALVDWLSAHWHTEDAAIVGWLMRLSCGLADRGGPLWDLVRDPRSTLHFELPLVGIAGEQGEFLVSGRVDLWVTHPDGNTVIDFKAGAHVPTGPEDLIEGASLRSYGPQLEAYRSVLVNGGERVDAVALWFVRTGGSVLW